jgi:hypothetical protein
MDAEIHAVDTERRESEGQTLTLRGTSIEVTLKRFEGLPFGELKDQHYVEVTATSWDGPTRSDLTARLDAEDLARLFAVAFPAGMIAAPVNPRVLELVERLRAELALGGSQPNT